MSEGKKIRSKSELTAFIEKTQAEVDGLMTEINAVSNLFKDFVEKPSDTELSKAEQLTLTYSKIKEKREEFERVIESIKEFETAVYGIGDEDKSSLSHKLDSLLKRMTEQEESWIDKHKALYKKIEALLPGATATGLSASYAAQKSSYNKPNNMWSWIFVVTMVFMGTYGWITFERSDDFVEAMINILSRAPFLVPVIWLAYFSSKQQSQNKRLMEEYAYKEALSKSYEGYKREIEKLVDSEDKTKILEKMVETMVQSAAYNPSATLEKSSHNDKGPFFFSKMFSRKEGNEEN